MSFHVSRFSFLVILLIAGAYAFAQQQPIGEVYASDATVQGSVQLTSGGTQVMSGANVTAGDAAARLRLARGGNVRICPQTEVTITASGSGRELMLAMGTGAIEADYSLQTSADTIVTPDFRIMLAGPGAFHFALRSRPNGDTCVQTRASNGSSIVVSELMSDATYQVKSNEMVLFRKGHVTNPDLNLPEDCGCPPPAPAEIAKPAEPPAQPETPKPVVVAAQPEEVAPQPKVEEPSPAPNPSRVQVEVEAPFVFRADDVVPPPPGAARVTLASLPQLPPPAVAEPPAAPAPQAQAAASTPEVPKADKKRKKGFFSRIGSFLATVFK